MKQSCHTIGGQGKVNEQELAGFLVKNGQILLHMVDLIEQCRMALRRYALRHVFRSTNAWNTFEEEAMHLKAIAFEPNSSYIAEGKLSVGGGASITSYAIHIATDEQGGISSYSDSISTDKGAADIWDYQKIQNEATGKVWDLRLHTAAQSGETYLAETALAEGADVNLRMKQGATPLHWAAAKGQEEIVGLLLDHGAEANATDDLGWTPVFLAADNGFNSIVNLLLEHGAKRNAVVYGKPVSLGSETGHDDDLLEAAESGNANAVTAALAAGANVNCTSRDGWTPLLEAARGDVGVVQLLLSSGANPNVSSAAGYTPLMRAAGHGCDAIVRLLIEAGAQLDAVDDKGQSALDMAYAEQFPGSAAIIEQALLRLKNPQPASPAPQDSASLRPSPGSLAGVPDAVQIRVVPVFVSSTFRDMHVERDLLRDVILPELQVRLNERRILLEIVDLRWGVDTLNESEILKKNLRVLEVCFAEIERSRPYFISLIGDRYGWIPPLSAAEGAAKEAGLIGSLAGASLTELEILFFLQKSGQASHFFCYLRDPLPYEELIRSSQMTLEKAVTYANEYLNEPMRTDVLKKRDSLKKRLLEGGGHTARYTAQWNPTEQAVDGLQLWKKRVLDDLWPVIDKDTQAWAEAAPTSWQEIERRTIERYLADVAARPEVRKTEIAALNDFATLPGNHEGKWARCTLGEPGSGKSSLLASLCLRLERENVAVLSQFVGLSPKSTSARAMYQRWTEQLQALGGNEQAIDPNPPADETVQRFWRILRTTSVGRRVVLIIDGVERFTSEDRLDWYASMASTCPSNVRVILSSVPSYAAVLKNRSGVQIQELGTLGSTDAEAVASWICRKYHRQIPANVLASLLMKRRPDGLSAVQNVRWLSIAMEELNLLGREEFEEADRSFAGTDEGRLQQLLERTVVEFPPTMEGLYERVLARTQRLDPGGAPAFIKLLATTRHGIGNADIQRMLETITGTPVDASRVAFLQRVFRAHLQLNASGIYELIDSGFASSVAAYFRISDEEQVSLHKVIAGYLEGLPHANPLRGRELMYHVLKAGNTDGAAKQWAQALAYGNTSEDWFAAKWTTFAVCDEVVRRGPAGIEWVSSVLRSPALSSSELRGILESFYDTLSITLLPRLALPEEQSLYKLLSDMFTELSTEGKADAGLLKGQLATQLEAGKISLSSGALKDALQTLQNALKTVDALRHSGPAANESDIVLGESMAHEQIGRTLAAMGRIEEAASAFQSAISAREKAPITGERDRQIAHYLIYLGETHSAVRRFDKALDCFQQAYRKASIAMADVDRAECELTMSLAREREGDLKLKLDDLDGAAVAFAEVRKIRKKLLDFAPTELSIFNEAVSSEKLGDILARKGQVREAREAYDAAKATYASLSATDPANVTWACAVASATGLIGDLERKQMHMLEAKAAYDEQLQLLEELQKQAPDKMTVLRSYMAALIDVGDLHMHLTDYESAEKTLTRAVEIAEALRKLNITNATAIRDLVVVHVKLAILSARLGKHGSAVNRYRKCIELIDEGLRLAPGDRRLQLDKAGFLWNLGSELESLNKSEDMAICLRESYVLHQELARTGPLPSPQDQIYAMLQQMFG